MVKFQQRGFFAHSPQKGLIQDFLGLTATAVVVLRWITALARLLAGGTATGLVVARCRK